MLRCFAIPGNCWLGCCLLQAPSRAAHGCQKRYLLYWPVIRHCGKASMRARPLSIILLVVAFFFSAWGNVIPAVLCPRHELNHDCCVTPRQTAQSDTCQHEMGGMDMREGQRGRESGSAHYSELTAIAADLTLALAPESAEVVSELPLESCAHCLIHSQLTSASATAAVDPAKRLIESDASAPSGAIALPSAVVVTIMRLAHGPPGNLFLRHVLINVFRI